MLLTGFKECCGNRHTFESQGGSSEKRRIFSTVNFSQQLTQTVESPPEHLLCGQMEPYLRILLVPPSSEQIHREQLLLALALALKESNAERERETQGEIHRAHQDVGFQRHEVHRAEILCPQH